MPRPKKGGLGKGLDALFVENATEVKSTETLSITEIEPDRDQPRKYFDQEALAELAASITTHGVLQPIVVRPTADGGYIIVAGERRWRAARIAGLTQVPVVVRDLTKQEADELALIENLQREDLNPVEEAAGYRKLMDAYGMTQEEVATRVGKSRPNVANAMRLLALPSRVLTMVSEGKISAGHARTLLPLEDEEKISSAAEKVMEEGLSVRKTEALVKAMNKEPTPQKQQPKPNFYREVELALGEHLGRRVQVSPRGDGGTIAIEFLDKTELEALVNKLSKE